MSSSNERAAADKEALDTLCKENTGKEDGRGEESFLHDKDFPSKGLVNFRITWRGCEAPLVFVRFLDENFSTKHVTGPLIVRFMLETPFSVFSNLLRHLKDTVRTKKRDDEVTRARQLHGLHRP